LGVMMIFIITAWACLSSFISNRRNQFVVC
jgi:hypothetical protein